MVLEALRVEKRSIRGRTLSCSIFLCPDCNTEFAVIANNAKRKKTNKCNQCSKKVIGSNTRKLPFEGLYNIISKKSIKYGEVFKYEEFLKFTSLPECIYCGKNVKWRPHRNKQSAAINLDRKDSNRGYTTDNCVVCCGECNLVKNNILTHDEMLVAMKAVLEYRKGRE